MLKIIQTAIAQRKQKQAEFEQMKTQMERQRSMLNEESVFLVNDFFQAAVEPLTQQDLNFAALYGEEAEIIQEWFNGNEPLLDLGMVPFAYLGEEAQQKLKKNVEVKAKATMQRRITAEKREGIEKPFNPEIEGDAFIESYIDRAISSKNFLAFKLWELGELLEDSGFMTYEDRAIKSGQGELVLNFWKALNELEDYKSLFPKNGGGSNEKDRLKKLVGKLQPVLGV